MKLLLVFFAILAACIAYEDLDIVSGRIESCRGCSLNRLPQVKEFIMNDAPKYEGLEVKFISGAPPELVLLGDGDNELERIPLSQLNRDECNELVQSKGFNKKSIKSDL